MFKDIITKEKMIGFFVVTNNRTEALYARLLYSIKNILTQNDNYNLQVEAIVSDKEIALVNSINEVFSHILRIGCYYHRIDDCKKNLSNFKLLNKANGLYNQDILKELAKIQLVYKGDMNIFDNMIKKIIDLNNNYEVYIKEYFVKTKKNYLRIIYIIIV